jgi:hypothetical protein
MWGARFLRIPKGSGFRAHISMNLRLKLIQLLTRHRRMVSTALLVVSIVGGGYGLLRQRDQAAVQPAAVSPWRALAAFTENGVTVAIALENGPSGQAWLVGTFTPVQEHFHLYSKDLPKDGIYGQGRPTLLEIVASSRVKPNGSLVANQPTVSHFTRAIEQSVPIYPDGPVTLRLPIAVSKGDAAVPTELSITYMSCSEEICLVPVVDKRVSVVIPDPTEHE